MSRRVEADRYGGAIERLVHDARAIPDLPERVGRMAGRGPVDRDRLVKVLERALDHFPPFPDEVAGFDLPEAIAYAETNLGHVRARARRNAQNPLIRERDAVLAEARAATPSWRWAERRPGRWLAEIEVGRLRFTSRFVGGGARDSWSQAWTGDADTNGLLDHLGDLQRRGTRIRTGLFGALDRFVKETIAEFMAEVRPAELRVEGLDGKRNAHNLATYGAHAPEGYVVEAVREPGSSRATADGVTGIRIVRPPEPAAVPGP